MTTIREILFPAHAALEQLIDNNGGLLVETALDVEHTKIHTNGIELHAVTAGPEQKPGKGTIVFLHGFPEFWYCWKNQIPAFSRDYRIVAPDMRGYNLSDKPDGVENYAMHHHIADLLGLIDALGEQRITLVAHDWGGAIAWAFASRHPEKLNHLVILNAPHPTTFMRELITNPKQQEATQYMNMLRSDRADQILSRNDYELMRKFVFSHTAPDTTLTDEDKERYVEAWKQPGAIRCSTNYYRAMPMAPVDMEKGEQLKQPEQLLKNIPEIRVEVPTLVIWGMADHALLPGLLDGLDQYVPDLTIRRVEGATHWITHDRPDDVNRHLREWLDERA